MADPTSTPDPSTPSPPSRPAIPPAGAEAGVGGGSGFLPTRWTVVLLARGSSSEAHVALGTLCEAYYAPVQEFVRAAVRDEEAARDLTQEFFARVLRGGAFDRADPQRGRFRSFLLGAVKHFLADSHDRQSARKRGGGQETIPLEPGTDTSPGFDAPDPKPSDLEWRFDRQWAFTMLGRALDQLGREMTAGGRSEQFEVLKPWLTGTAPQLQSEAAARLGLNENAVKVAIHRLRVRFRELVKTEIGQTVEDPTQIPAELNYLIEVVARAG